MVGSCVGIPMLKKDIEATCSEQSRICRALIWTAVDTFSCRPLRCIINQVQCATSRRWCFRPMSWFMSRVLASSNLAFRILVHSRSVDPHLSHLPSDIYHHFPKINKDSSNRKCTSNFFFHHHYFGRNGVWHLSVRRPKIRSLSVANFEQVLGTKFISLRLIFCFSMIEYSNIAVLSLANCKAIQSNSDLNLVKSFSNVLYFLFPRLEPKYK
jgi:hypothetical protein